jgi:polar amino acid transport system substrate-binding protein
MPANSPHSGPRGRLILIICLVWSVALDALSSTDEAPYQARVCIDDYPPLSYFVEDRATGAMIDALNIIGERMNFTVVPSPDTPFARCLRMAEAGLTDFVVSLIPTPERLVYLVMFPYAEIESLRFLVLANQKKVFDNLGKIKLARLGLVNGFQYPDEFHDKSLNVVLSPNAEAGVRLLRSHRIDILLLNHTVAQHLVKHELINRQFPTQPIALLPYEYVRDGNPNSIALSKKSPLMARQAELAATIEQMRRAGTFEQLIDKHQKRP